MDDREKRGDLILHPHFSAKLREIDALREDLSVLIEEQESLLYGASDLLTPATCHCWKLRD